MYLVRQTEEFQEWLDGLHDRRAQVRIAARLRLGDWKSLGGGVNEMRVDVGAGYRLYFTRRDHMLIVMLAGGDKSSQTRDIKRARRIIEMLES
jgi:putative addiction module killer protein